MGTESENILQAPVTTGEANTPPAAGNNDAQAETGKQNQSKGSADAPERGTADENTADPGKTSAVPHAALNSAMKSVEDAMAAATKSVMDAIAAMSNIQEASDKE